MSAKGYETAWTKYEELMVQRLNMITAGKRGREEEHKACLD